MSMLLQTILNEVKYPESLIASRNWNGHVDNEHNHNGRHNGKAWHYEEMKTEKKLQILR